MGESLVEFTEWFLPGFSNNVKVVNSQSGYVLQLQETKKRNLKTFLLTLYDFSGKFFIHKSVLDLVMFSVSVAGCRL